MPHDDLILLPFLGLAAGSLGTLVGAGGGFLLMPILLLLYPEESPASITAISLAVTGLNALAGTLSYARMGGRILYRAGAWFAAACVPGAWLGARATYAVDSGRFRIVFAVFLAVLSIALFVRGPAGSDREFRPFGGLSRRAIGLGGGLSLGVGFVSSFLGIGGGILHVPILAGLLRVPVHLATATSQFVLLFSALTATLVHGAGGWLSAELPRVAALGAGVLVGAPLGALGSRWVRAGFILRLLALALCLVSLRLALAGAPRAPHAAAPAEARRARSPAAFFLEPRGASP